MENVNYIVLGGGGQKGLLYIGALKALRRFMEFDLVLKRIKGFAGCSVGSIFAVMMMMEYTEEEIDQYILPLVSIFDNVAPQMDVSLFISNYGFDDGSTFKKSISKVLEYKGFSQEITLKTFQQFFAAEISIITTNLTNQEKVTLSAKTFPNLKVVDALFMSMCIPFIFVPVHYNDCVYVDGGMTSNIPDIYPISETMVFCFDKHDYPINSWGSYVSQLMTMPIILDAEKKENMKKSCAYSLSLRCPPFMKDSLDRNMNELLAFKIVKYGYIFTLLKINSSIIATTEILLRAVILVHLNFYADLSTESAECLL